MGWEDPLGEEMATHSSILAGRIPRTEETGGLDYGVTESDTTEQLSPTHTRWRERILVSLSTTFPPEQRRTKCPEVWHGRRGRGIPPPFLGQGWAGIFSDCLWSSLQHSTQSVTAYLLSTSYVSLTVPGFRGQDRQKHLPS